MVLGQDDVQAVLVKDLAIASYDQLADGVQTSAGGFRELAVVGFEKSGLYKPGEWSPV